MSTKKNLIERWKPYKNLSLVLKKGTGFDNDGLDYRGFPFADSHAKKNIKGIKLEDVNFLYANFENCMFTKGVFKNCVFETANFKEIGLWDCTFIECKFIKTDFQNAMMGVNTVYQDCVFDTCKLKGKYFNFGSQAKFLDCTFSKCDIRSAWILSVIFENSKFESKFANIRFSGIKEANLRGKKEFPATFKNCDMKNSMFKSLEIMDGAKLENTVLPNQESIRFNDDRTYYE
ncbi:pentapeptide repeat-containing protein [Maribacter sp. UBA4516]|uniref:pentapeptide repeat-containing protein n=1 Tax=Maribacter sp. UBA4516 TaxID=1946804 RepID=UPI00257F3B5B|nr:pentapeptide repeat-containing protein [Maribacter sp. UBA4516]|tara:strand:+ start:344 stop:1039 length:696 start_codon:yes stop_codon:yes gene_type:complete